MNDYNSNIMVPIAGVTSSSEDKVEYSTSLSPRGIYPAQGIYLN
jgi:hypothetical protein